MSETYEPSIVSDPAPGPISVRSSTAVASAPVVSVMRPQASWLRLIVSPLAAFVTASRRLPAPLSLQFATSIVTACGGEPACAPIGSIEPTCTRARVRAAWRGRRREAPEFVDGMYIPSRAETVAR